MRDIYIEPPQVPTAQDFDEQMRDAYREETFVHLAEGVYKTAMTPEWNRIRADRGFLLNGKLEGQGDSTVLMADSSAILDSDINDEPQRLITGRGVFDYVPAFDTLTPQQVWDALPRNQSVSNMKLVCSHSQLVERWRKAGASLRTSGVLLQGHGGLIDKVTLSDVGAWRSTLTPDVGAETFPASICGATSAPDRDAIAQLDRSTHQFEAASITNSVFTDYVPEATNDQVTVFMVMGSMGEPAGWNTGDWQFTWRKDAQVLSNKILAHGTNQVQGVTIYLAEQGACSLNESDGADILYYVDYVQSRGVVIEQNKATKCRHGVSVRLSPVPIGLAEKFFHENYTIGPNKIDSSDANVVLNTFGATTATRYMKNFAVDAALSLKVIGDVPGLSRINQHHVTARGCNPFKRGKK